MMAVKRDLLVILALCLFIQRSQQEATSEQRDISHLLDLVLEKYDPRVRPASSNGTGPVVVKVNILLRDVTSISDYDMDFGVQILLRQEWIDDRLAYDAKENFKYLQLTDLTRIWTPDLFIMNEKDSELHKLMNSNTFIRIRPSGKVLYSARLSLTLWCHMNMERFPFETQICSMKMASYGLTTSDQVFQWREAEPLQISTNANIMGFTILAGSTFNCYSNTNTGEYSCLKVSFPFKRDTKYYLLHNFLPNAVLVIVSWGSFWLDHRAIAARVLLVLWTLVTTSSLAADLEASIPHVPYIKAMDLWTSVCFGFLLAALAEFALVSAATRRLDGEDRSPGGGEGHVAHATSTERNDDGNTDVEMNPLVVRSTDNSTKLSPPSTRAETSRCPGLMSRLPSDPCRIDSAAQLLFPAAFFGFVLIYFFTYLVLLSSSNEKVA